MTRMRSALLCMLLLALVGCGSNSSSPVAEPNNNDKLNGAYIVDLTGGEKFYVVLNGAGGITQLGMFSSYNPPGSYSVSTADEFTVTLKDGGGDIAITGTLISAPSFSFTATQGGSNIGSGTIYKVTDIGACGGLTWGGGSYTENGSVRTGSLSFTVDSTGAIVGGSIVVNGTTHNFVERSFFCTARATGGIFAGFLVTDTTPSPSSYQQIWIYGLVDDAGYIGPDAYYKTDGGEFGAFEVFD